MTNVNSISIVVPVYQSAPVLPVLARRLVSVMEALGVKYEIILVDDGSRDGSWEQIESLAEENDFLRGINLMRNFGQHNALLCGIREAGHEVIVTLDDDLQHPPEEIPKLLEKLSDNDVVYGTPVEEQHGVYRDLASQLTKWALKSAMGAETARHVSAFRAFRARLRDAFADYHSPSVSIDVLLTWGTVRFGSVAVRHDPRREGKSNYTFRKLVTHAFNMLTGFSTLPLQLASLVGFAFTLLGVLILAYVVGRYFMEGGVVRGFPFLASIICLFSGAQLFALGIMGEYMARMHFRMMERPAYVVRGKAGRSRNGN